MCQFNEPFTIFHLGLCSGAAWPPSAVEPSRGGGGREGESGRDTGGGSRCTVTMEKKGVNL